MVVCYELGSKEKSKTIMRSFAAGCNGSIASVCEPKLLDGDCAFYGVRPEWLHLWEQAKLEKRDWWYVDNAYFDSGRETYFRVTRNALQCDGQNAVWNDKGAARLKALGITIKDWQGGGGHIVVCPQSEEFTRICGGYAGDWLADAVAVLSKHTDRPIRIRRKNDVHPLGSELRGAHALVTPMSCAAVEALVAGVPVFCTERCAAQIMGLSDLSLIETPEYPDRRQEFMELLAANQWTISEMADGTCWSAFEEQRQRGIGHYGDGATWRTLADETERA